MFNYKVSHLSLKKKIKGISSIVAKGAVCCPFAFYFYVINH